MKRLIGAVICAVLIVLISLSIFKYKEHDVIVFLLLLLFSLFLLPLFIRSLFVNLQYEDVLNRFMGLENERVEGLTYNVLKDYISNISAVVFLLTILIYSKWNVVEYSGLMITVLFSLCTAILIIYASLALLEFIRRIAGDDQHFKKAFFGSIALIFQTTVLEIGLDIAAQSVPKVI